jgi:hypothetical protein
MYAVVRRIKMRSIDEAARRAADGLGPVFKQSPGFIAYHVIQFGNDSGGSVTLFETQAAAEEANRKALDWIRQNLADFTEGDPEVLQGEVLASVMGASAGTQATAA